MKVKVDNFRIFKGLEAEFSPGLNIIYSKISGSGKTTVLQSILTSLINNIPVNKDLTSLKKDDFKHKGKDYSCQLTTNDFIINSNYEGTVLGKPIVGQKDERLDEWNKFLQIDNNSRKEIMRLFTSKVYITHDTSSLLELGKTERSNLLLDLFELSWIKDVRDKVSADFKAIKSAMSSSEVIIDTLEYSDVDCASINEKISRLQLLVQNVPTSQRAAVVEHSIGASKNTILANNARVELEIKKIEAALREQSKSILELALDTLRNEFNTNYSELEEVDTSVLSGLESQKRMNDDKIFRSIALIEKAQNCPECETELQIRSNKIESFNKESLESEITELRAANILFDSRIALIKEYSQYAQAKSRFEREEKALIDSIAIFDTKTQELEDKIVALTEAKTKFAEEQEVVIVQLEKELLLYQMNEGNYQELEVLQRDLVKAELLEGQNKKIERAVDTIEKHKLSYADHDYLLKTGLKEFKVRIIEEKCEYFEYKINEYLAKFDCGLEVKFNLKKNKDGEVSEIVINVIKGERVTEFFSCSSGERQMLSFATIFAQSDAHAHKIDDLGILMIDDIAMLSPNYEKCLGDILKDTNKTVIITTVNESSIANLQPDALFEMVQDEAGETQIIKV